MTTDTKKIPWILALVLVAAVIAYLPALQAGFIWDDDAYVENNGNLRDLGGLLRIWLEPRSSPQYYPMVHTTFWVEFQCFGLNPLVFHLTNLLLHLTSTCLLWVLLRRLALPGALWVAGLFALHPVMVESVAWVTERKNVLSMVFYLSAMLACVRGLGLATAPRSTGRGWWVQGLILFALALASKSVTFSLPFAVLVLVWWRRGRVAPQEVLAMLPLMGIGIAYGAFTSHLEATHVMAVGPEWDQSIGERLLIAGRVPWFYLSKLLWPWELTFIYPRWEVDTGSWTQLLFPVATALLLGGLIVRVKRLGDRGSLAAVLLFGGTLFPALGFIDVYPFRYSFVADHFQYHAAIPVLVLLGVLAARRVPASWQLPLACLVLGFLGVRTFLQASKYESREVLYQSILADDPDGWFAHNNLAALKVTKQEFEAAFEGYRTAHHLHPLLAPHATSEAYAHGQVGSMIGKTWSLRPALQAMSAYRRFVMDAFQEHQRTGVEVPGFKAEAEARYARIRELRDRFMPQMLEAERRFEKSLALSPEHASACIDYGMLCQALGQLALDEEDGEKAAVRMATAQRVWTRSLRLQPSNGVLRQRLIRVHQLRADHARRTGQTAVFDEHQAAIRSLSRGGLAF